MTRDLTPEAKKAMEGETTITICDGPPNTDTVKYVPGDILFVGNRCHGQVRWSKDGRLQQRWILEYYGAVGVERIEEDWRDVPTEE